MGSVTLQPWPPVITASVAFGSPSARRSEQEAGTSMSPGAATAGTGARFAPSRASTSNARGADFAEPRLDIECAQRGDPGLDVRDALELGDMARLLGIEPGAVLGNPARGIEKDRLGPDEGGDAGAVEQVEAGFHAAREMRIGPRP